MILLDTNAVIWLLTGHSRGEPLRSGRHRLAVSPVSLLELQLLIEVGRLQAAAGLEVADVIVRRGWRIDNPSSHALFGAALAVDWTRDPFDRLIVAHARLRRWPLATGDRLLLERSSESDVIAL